MPQQLTFQDIADLKKQGFTEEEILEAYNEMEYEELSGSQQQLRLNQDPRQFSQQSSFASVKDDNLIKWQLELNDILERAEHILKGDVPTYKNGQVVWEKNPEPEKNPLNDYGVNEILKILSLYINRNLILSDYDREEINYKVHDFGRRLSNLIFMRYEELGMDDEHKRKHYSMIVGELVDIVHSGYKRALMGGERRSLREMISVSQNTQTQGTMTPSGVVVNTGMGMPPKERSVLNPLRYLGGKYK